MRITARQLRQIIKEELQREANSSGYDIPDPDLTDLPDEPQVAMPRPAADISALQGGLGPEGLRYTMEQAIKSDIPAAAAILKSPNWPATSKILNDVFYGKRLLQMGDRGDAVKIMQYFVKAKLVQMLDALADEVSTERQFGGDLGVAQSNSAMVAQNAMRGQVIYAADLESAVADVLDRLVPDGDYGKITRDAVAIMQIYMQQHNTDAKFSGVVDGKIGRQTMQYMLGNRNLAAVTGI